MERLQNITNSYILNEPVLRGGTRYWSDGLVVPPLVLAIIGVFELENKITHDTSDVMSINAI